jgi:hypothetical protein
MLGRTIGNSKETAMPYRIPTTNDDFDAYIRSTAAALLKGTPTTAVRLGLTADQLAKWQEYRNAWAGFYADHEDKSKRTTTITNEKNKVRKEFIAFASPILTAMSVHSALTEGDRLTFRLPKRDRTMTKRSKIDETAEVFLKPTGGCSINVSVRTFTDGNRASMHPMAHHLELRYQLVAPEGLGPSGVIWPDAPHSVAECHLVHISTRALFKLQLELRCSGMRLYTFCRWVNATDPDRSGPWSQVRQCLVL